MLHGQDDIATRYSGSTGFDEGVFDHCLGQVLDDVPLLHAALLALRRLVVEVSFELEVYEHFKNPGQVHLDVEKPVVSWVFGVPFLVEGAQEGVEHLLRHRL